MAFLPENNWEKILPDLPAYKKYKELDNVDISGKSNDYCINYLGRSDGEDRKFCNQIAKNLKKISIEDDPVERRYSCNYFRQWFHDNIGKRYYVGNEKGEKIHVSDSLFNFVSAANIKYIKDSACNGDTFGDPEEWKEEKDLHDYFINFNHIKCNDYDKDKCEKYVDYVTYINRIYQKKIGKCCDEDDLGNLFCIPSIKCGAQYQPYKLLIALNQSLLSLGKKREAALRQVPFREVALREEAPAKYVAAKPGPGVSETARTLHYQETSSPSQRHDDEEEIHAVSYYTSEHEGDAVPLDIDDSSVSLGTTHEELGSNLFRNIFLAAGVLGLVSFFFYYNKSSLLKSRSRRRKRKKSKSKANYYEENENELETYDSGDATSYSEGDQYYLNYQPNQSYLNYQPDQSYLNYPSDESYSNYRSDEIYSNYRSDQSYSNYHSDDDYYY
ncbi:unnamed protein product [Plasmodium vivax]|uniref:(malaria parasite P. vivax) hypothetical protein n=1 Tax=Plasmodium vivax TaxID=5855 RepID=A0A8S4HH28_PLAVI|nr:unnamed protein product [Plasmodium vivax]